MVCSVWVTYAVAARAQAEIASRIVQSSVSRVLVLQLALFLFPACGSEDPPASGDGGGAGAGSGSGGSTSSGTHAQLRFLHHDDWKDHLSTCAWISDYRIKFGANPIPVTAQIELMSDSLSEYVEVDGRSYQDSDVLHIFTCNKSQTSKQTLQLYGKFGIDLPLEPGKRYTVTLTGTAATFAEDP